MPLYMDCHQIPGITMEEVEQAHLMDLAVQEKYQVKYLSYWANLEEGRIFCLMEAPNKEAIHKTHMEANGVETCNIVEVEGGLYSAFMGSHLKEKNDMVLLDDGTPDGGFRFMLNLDIIATTSLNHTIDFEELVLPQKPLVVAEKIIRKNQGNIINQLSFDQILAVFKSPESCLQCAIQIKNEFINSMNDDSKEWKIVFKMGLSVGEPVSLTDHSIFEKAIDECMNYCKIASENEIVLPKTFEDISVFCEQLILNHSIVVLNYADQQFVNLLFEKIDSSIDDYNFRIDQLAKEIGISRTKLYRKINSLTNSSPIKFLRDVKLRHALTLIKKGDLTISEIAYLLGYSNPSYFSKQFKQEYGYSPSEILVS